jgi:hypothetical protein
MQLRAKRRAEQFRRARWASRGAVPRALMRLPASRRRAPIPRSVTQEVICPIVRRSSGRSRLMTSAPRRRFSVLLARMFHGPTFRVSMLRAVKLRRPLARPKRSQWSGHRHRRQDRLVLRRNRSHHGQRLAWRLPCNRLRRVQPRDRKRHRHLSLRGSHHPLARKRQRNESPLRSVSNT